MRGDEQTIACLLLKLMSTPGFFIRAEWLRFLYPSAAANGAVSFLRKKWSGHGTRGSPTLTTKSAAIIIPMEQRA